MATYKLSVQADQRISDIYAYSVQTWGKDVAQDYFFGLHDCLDLLAQNPNMGMSFHEFRRFPYRSHMIYFSKTDYGIQVEQIFHKSENVDDKL